MTANMIQPSNILIIKPSSIGDVVHTLPIWSVLRKRFPAAKITWLIAPACAGIVEGLPGIELLQFDRKNWGKAWRSPSAARDLLAFQRALRDRHFDLVLDVQGLFRSGWFTWKTRSPMRVGFANAREMAWLFYTRRVDVGPTEQHAVDRYLKLLDAIGCPADTVEFPLPITDRDRQRSRELCGDGSPYAVLCPGANWPTKRWPAAQFAQLVTPLRQRWGLRTIVAGGPGDRRLGEEITGGLNRCGETSLMELAAMTEGASVVVTNDSGPMHIAAALKRPLVAVFGPTNPVRTGPYGMPGSIVRANVACSPCYRRECPRPRCMDELGPEAVLSAIERQISSAASRGE